MCRHWKTKQIGKDTKEVYFWFYFSLTKSIKISKYGLSFYKMQTHTLHLWQSLYFTVPFATLLIKLTPLFLPLFNHENYPSNRHYDLNDFRLLCQFSVFQSHWCSFQIRRYDPASSRALNVLLPLTTGSSQIHISSHILLKHIFKRKSFGLIYVFAHLLIVI